MHDTIGTAGTPLRSLWVIGHRVTPIPCGGRVVALEVATPAEVPGPPPHYHADCAEFFYVTAGRLGVMRDGEWTTLVAGAYAEILRRVVHTFRNDGHEEVRAITGFEPTGFEVFFEDFGYDVGEPGSFEASVSEESLRRVGRLRPVWNDPRSAAGAGPMTSSDTGVVERVVDGAQHRRKWSVAGVSSSAGRVVAGQHDLPDWV